MSGSSSIGNNGPGQIISSVRSIRLAIFLTTTTLIAACAVFNIIDFQQPQEMETIDTIYFDNLTSYNQTNSTEAPTTTQLPRFESYDIPPFYLFLCGISLSAISAFLRAGFILKLFMMLLTVILQTVILYTSRLFEQYELYNDSM